MLKLQTKILLLNGLEKMQYILISIKYIPNSDCYVFCHKKCIANPIVIKIWLQNDDNILLFIVLRYHNWVIVCLLRRKTQGTLFVRKQIQRIKIK